MSQHGVVLSVKETGASCVCVSAQSSISHTAGSFKLLSAEQPSAHCWKVLCTFSFFTSLSKEDI